MIIRIRRVAALLFVVLGVIGAVARVSASDTMFLRVFLKDGTPVVSYGEYARVNDNVVFSMPVGGTADTPRLHLISIPDTSVDWTRTEHYVASARYQQYAASAGEEDFARLSNDVARVLSTIALTTEPARALEIATRARAQMKEWPAAHYGYRQREVNDIVELLDESIANLRASAGVATFDVALAANAPMVELEPVLGLPGLRESLDGVLAVVRLTERSSDRVLLLQSALGLLDEVGPLMTAAKIAELRDSIRGQILEERAIDHRYDRMSRALLASASRAASTARVRDVEAVMARVSREDRRLGQKRPEVVQALQASLQYQLDAARRLRLLRDQWTLRKDIYRGYQRAIGTPLLRLVKAQPPLEAIRRLDGPELDTLASLQSRLSGGAEQLQRMLPPMDLRGVHDMLIGAWRFAEQAVNGRTSAVHSGNVNTAWEASSAAAASLMLLSNAQEQLRSFVEPPQLR